MRSSYNRSRHKGVLKAHRKEQAAGKNFLRNKAPVIPVAKKARGQQNTYFNKNRDNVENRWFRPMRETIRLETKAPARKRNIHNATTLAVFQSSMAIRSANKAA